MKFKIKYDEKKFAKLGSVFKSKSTSVTDKVESVTGFKLLNLVSYALLWLLGIFIFVYCYGTMNKTLSGIVQGNNMSSNVSFSQGSFAANTEVINTFITAIIIIVLTATIIFLVRAFNVADSF